MTKLIVCKNFREAADQPSCAAKGSRELITFLEGEISHRALNIELVSSVCMGRCPKGPNVKLSNGDFIHEADKQKLTEWLDNYEAGQSSEA